VITSNTNFNIILPSTPSPPMEMRYLNNIYPTGCSFTNANVHLIIIVVIITEVSTNVVTSLFKCHAMKMHEAVEVSSTQS
jgi:hypothetical protein